MKTTKLLTLLATILLVCSCGIFGGAGRTRPWPEYGHARAEGYDGKNDRIKKVPYIYFSGEGVSWKLSLAEEMARSNAYAAVGKVITSEKVYKAAKRNSRKARRGLTLLERQSLNHALSSLADHVDGRSAKVAGFTPFAMTTVRYNEEEGIYTVWARVGMPQSNWNTIVRNLLDYKPLILSEKVLEAYELTKVGLIEDMTRLDI